MKPTLILIGADKGGVGKTTVARTMLNYFADNNVFARAFDTEFPRGTLQRFHPGITEVVDIGQTPDQMRILDTLNTAQVKVTVMDTRAGALTTSLHALREVGFLDAVKQGRFALALRIPAWADGKASLAVNGLPVAVATTNGYALVHRAWKKGDVVTLNLPLDLRLENAAGSTDTVAVLRGPLVMAADLGPAEAPWAGVDPAMVGETPLAAFAPMVSDRPRYHTTGLIRPADLTFVPFFSQYDRRSAVYFKRFSEAGWKAEQAAFLAEQARQKDLAARSIDVMHLGEMQPERDHGLTSDISYPVAYRGRNGRDARSGGYFEFAMKVKPGPLVLQASYWGGERARTFDILVDNVRIATQTLDNDHPGAFFDVDYPLPEPLTRGKDRVKVRFVPADRSSAGPVFGVRIFTAKPGETAAGAKA